MRAETLRRALFRRQQRRARFGVLARSILIESAFPVWRGVPTTRSSCLVKGAPLSGHA
jgi:hypothetical protein